MAVIGDNDPDFYSGTIIIHVRSGTKANKIRGFARLRAEYGIEPDDRIEIVD